VRPAREVSGSSNPPRNSCAVATPHAAATEAGTDAFLRGGNALDAALSAAFALCVAYPHNTSLGGDLFALVQAPDGTIRSINASGPAGRHVDPERVAARHGRRMPVRGIDTVTLPGAVAGLGALHDLGAARPWGAHLEAAVTMATAGVPVASSLARAIEEDLELIGSDTGLSALLSPGGRPLRRGDALVQPELARTLQRVAAGGPGAFYRGELAREHVEWLRASGSALDEGDFATFAPSLDAGIVRTVRGHEVFTAGPNSQGFLLLEILQALDLLECHDPLGSGAGVLSALFALANRDRDRLLADPDAMTVSVDGLLDPGRWSVLTAGLATGPATLSDGGGGARAAPAPVPRAGGDTIALVTADSDGWAVSLIQSLFHSFGAGLRDPQSGVIFHDRGALFSLDPSSPNVLSPGKRPAHTLMPVLVRRDGRLRVVAGTMGGRAQPQIHAQVLLRLFDGADPQAAVTSARWMVESSGDADLALVERGVSAAATHAITTRMPLLALDDLDETVGHTQLVVVDDDRGGPAFSAGSDPRADGLAAVASGG
jgi:gamma-glutamyltranspeptidase